MTYKNECCNKLYSYYILKITNLASISFSTNTGLLSINGALWIFESVASGESVHVSSSTGRTGFLPNMSSNGQYLVESCLEVLYAKVHVSKWSAKLVLNLLQNFTNINWIV